MGLPLNQIPGLKNIERDRYIILSVTFRLTPGGAATVRYPEVRNAVGEERDLGAVRDTVLAIRRRKAMVIDPNELPPSRRPAPVGSAAVPRSAP